MHAARNFNARCIGLTRSEHQFNRASETVEAEGLGAQVEILLANPFEIDRRFDCITSTRLFRQAVPALEPEYFSMLGDLLKEDGTLVIHQLTSTEPGLVKRMTGSIDFFAHHLCLPGGLPHLFDLLGAMEEGYLEVSALLNLRQHAARTFVLLADTLDARLLPEDKAYGKYDVQALRGYLRACAKAFYSNEVTVHEIVAHKAGSAA